MNWDYEALQRFLRTAVLSVLMFLLGSMAALRVHGQSSTSDRLSKVEVAHIDLAVEVARHQTEIDDLRSHVGTIEGFGTGISFALTLLLGASTFFKGRANGNGR